MAGNAIPSVSEQCHSCITSLKGAVSALSNSEKKSHISQRDVNEELERLSLWVGNIGALHKSESPLSMESRLVEAQEILTHTQDLLGDLVEVTSEILRIASGEREAEIDFGLPDELAAPDNEQYGMNEEVELLEEIQACISRLFRLSSLIRHAAPTDLFAKALSKSRLQFNDEFDISHVTEKFPKLASDESKWLATRLGRAITKRRQFLAYMQNHRTMLGAANTEPASSSAEKMSASQNKRPQASTPILLDTASRPSTYITKASTIAPDQITPQMLTVEAESEPEEETRSHTTVSHSINEDKHISTLARIPKLADLRVGRKNEVECPLCFRMKKFKDDRAWRKHVFSDLRSYNCTFPGCNYQLFGDRNDWFRHELQMHRVSYSCRLCHEKAYSSEAPYLAHVRNKHPELLVDVEEQPLLEISRKPLDQLLAQACPFCDNWSQRLAEHELLYNNAEHVEASEIAVLPNIFKRHVAAHLEELALFAIPIGVASEGSAADSDAAIEQTESDFSNQPSLSALTFNSSRSVSLFQSQIDPMLASSGEPLEDGSASEERGSQYPWFQFTEILKDRKEFPDSHRIPKENLAEPMFSLHPILENEELAAEAKRRGFFISENMHALGIKHTIDTNGTIILTLEDQLCYNTEDSLEMVLQGFISANRPEFDKIEPRLSTGYERPYQNENLWRIYSWQIVDENFEKHGQTTQPGSSFSRGTTVDRDPDLPQLQSVLLSPEHQAKLGDPETEADKLQQRRLTDWPEYENKLVAKEARARGNTISNELLRCRIVHLLFNDGSIMVFLENNLPTTESMIKAVVVNHDILFTSVPQGEGSIVRTFCVKASALETVTTHVLVISSFDSSNGWRPINCPAGIDHFDWVKSALGIQRSHGASHYQDAINLLENEALEEYFNHAGFNQEFLTEVLWRSRIISAELDKLNVSHKVSERGFIEVQDSQDSSFQATRRDSKIIVLLHDHEYNFTLAEPRLETKWGVVNERMVIYTVETKVPDLFEHETSLLDSEDSSYSYDTEKENLAQSSLARRKSIVQKGRRKRKIRNTRLKRQAIQATPDAMIEQLGEKPAQRSPLSHEGQTPEPKPNTLDDDEKSPPVPLSSPALPITKDDASSHSGSVRDTSHDRPLDTTPRQAQVEDDIDDENSGEVESRGIVDQYPIMEEVVPRGHERPFVLVPDQHENSPYPSNSAWRCPYCGERYANPVEDILGRGCPVCRRSFPPNI